MKYTRITQALGVLIITLLVLQPYSIVSINTTSIHITPKITQAQTNSECQGNQNCLGIYDEWTPAELGQTEGSDAANNPDIARAQADREAKDAEAAKKDAENIKKLQEEDRKKCESILSGNEEQGGKIGKVFKNIFTKTATGLLSSQLPPEFQGVFNDTIFTAINDPTNLNKAVGQSFEKAFVAGTNMAFSQNFERSINQETNGGQLSIAPGRLQEIIDQTLQISIKSALPQATNQAIKGGLAISTRNAIKQTIPELTSKRVELGVADDFRTNGADQVRAQLGGPLFSLISDNARLNQQDILSVNGSDTRDLQNLTNLIIELLIKSMEDQLINTTQATGVQENSSGATSTITRTQGPLNQKIGGEVLRKYQEFLANQDNAREVDALINELPIEALLKDSGVDTVTQRLLSEPTTQNKARAGMEAILAAFPSSNIAQSINTGNLINGGQVNIQETINQVITQVQRNLPSGSGGGSNPTNFIFQQAMGDMTGNLSQSVGSFINSSISGEPGAYSNFGESFTSGLSNGLGDMTGNLANGLFNKALGDTPFAGIVDISFLTDSLSTSVTGVFTDIFNGEGVNIVANFSENFSNIGTGLAQAAIGAIADLAGIPRPVADLAQDAVVTTASLVIPFVPTQEKIGPLLSSIKKTTANTAGTQENVAQINQTTRSQEQLDVETCTQLRAIQRMEAATEQQNKIENPDIVRQAATKLEQYRQDLLNWTKNGYDSTGQGPDSPLYVQNINDHLDLVDIETKNVYLDNLKNSNDVFKAETAQILEENNEASLSSTITREQYNSFAQNRIGNTQEWWSALYKITDPFSPNSPETSLTLQNAGLASKQNEAKIQAIEEVVSNSGYLPVRECEEFTSDGKTCKRWKINTPANEVKESITKALASRIDQYLNPQFGFVADGNEPTVEDIRTFTPQTNGGGAGGPGTKTSNNILGRILAFLNTIRATQDNRGSVVFNYTTNTDAVGTPTSIRLAWQGTNVLACNVDDTWIGSGTNTSFIDIIKPAGEDLGKSGSFTLPAPITFDLRFSRIRASSTPTELLIPLATSTNTSTLYSRRTITIPSDIRVGDTLAVRLWPYVDSTSVLVPVTSANSSSLLQAIASAVVSVRNQTENPLQRDEFLKYTFTTDGNNSITVSPKVSYGIACVDKQGNTVKKSVTIGR